MNRRSVVLSGMALPFLSSLSAAEKKVGNKIKTSKNVVFLCMDFGFLRQDLLYGKNGDCDSPYFDMLKDIKGKYTFFHSTHQPNLLNSSHSAHPATLTCVKHSQRAIYPMESVDQYIASQSIRENRYKTVTFATTGTGRVNWNSSAQRVPGISKITDFHQMLFGKVDTKEELTLAQEQLTILSRAHNEIVKKSSTAADKMLGSSLKVKLNELNEDIFWIQKGKADFGVEIDPALGKEDQHTQIGNALNLCADAFKHKLTKVATVYFDGQGSIGLKGVNTGFHGLSHKPKSPEALVKKKLVDEFVLKSIIDHVKYLEKNQLLNDTIVVVSGAMGNSASHSNRNLPVFLIGGGLKHQGVLSCMANKELKISLADVYQTVVAELGLPPMKLPFCKGPVKELLS